MMLVVRVGKPWWMSARRPQRSASPLRHEASTEAWHDDAPVGSGGQAVLWTNPPTTSPFLPSNNSKPHAPPTPGTLLFVTHDRRMLNAVHTSTRTRSRPGTPGAFQMTRLVGHTRCESGRRYGGDRRRGCVGYQVRALVWCALPAVAVAQFFLPQENDQPRASPMINRVAHRRGHVKDQATAGISSFDGRGSSAWLSSTTPPSSRPSWN
jgi:hypothetical protein